MKPLRELACAVAAVGLLACRERPTPPRVPVTAFRLDSVGSFGTPALDTAIADSGALSNIIAIGQDAQSSTYVLDAGYKRVVVFKNDGTVRRTFGRFGSDSGEFILPTAMDIVDGGAWIFDYRQSRVTEFDSSGHFRRQFTVPRPAKSLRVANGMVWLSVMPSQHWMVMTYDTLGAIADSSLPVEKSSLQYAPHGPIAIVGRMPSGEVIVADQRPGLWYRRTDTGFVQLGSAAIPDGKPVSSKEMSLSSGDAFAIAPLEHGRLAILYSIRPPRAKSSADVRSAIDIFEDNGKYLATIPLPSYTPVMASTMDGTSLLLSRKKPFPHVVQLRVTELSGRLSAR